MKATAFALGLAISFAVGSTLLAADKDQNRKENSPAPADKTKMSKKQGGESQKVEITVSYIKRDVKKQGQIVEAPNQVYVLDSDTIRQTGATDVSQVLIRRGFRR